MAKTDVRVKLVGKDWNVSIIMSTVQKELKKVGLEGLAKEYIEKCTKVRDYDELLRVTRDYVEIE